MRDRHAEVLDLEAVLSMLTDVMDRRTIDSPIGRVLTPGPTYLGMWARDTGIASLGLNRLGRTDLSRDLLRRYWSYQITDAADPETFVFRNKRFADWTEKDAFSPTRAQLAAEIGAFPTTVYLDTPNFAAGTQEIYSIRADLDSVAWLIIAAADWYGCTGDSDLVHELAPQVEQAVRYLNGRDDDGDHLLEQDPNEDWADILLRHGKVGYTQAVWYRALGAAAEIFDVVGRHACSAWCSEKQMTVRGAINRVLLTPHGYYANFRAASGTSLRRSLDTALLVAFGVPYDGTGKVVLERLGWLDGPFGPSVIEPGYAPADIGPGKYPPGQYHNEGIWPWIASYLALAWARAGEGGRALSIITALLGPDPTTVHEWVDGLTGERHHPDFATGAGALGWAITEGGLAPTRR